MTTFAPFRQNYIEATASLGEMQRLNQKRAARLLLRFCGHLPFFMAASALLLPDGLSLSAAIAISLTYSMFCCEIAGWLNFRQEGSRPAFSVAETPLLGSMILVAAMVFIAPSWALVLSPASFGEFIDQPVALLPQFFVLIMPSCMCFAACQLRNRSQLLLSRRLGTDETCTSVHKRMKALQVQ